MKRVFLFLSVLLLSINLWAGEKQTILYSVKDEKELYLDLYKVDNPKGCVIFAFGGGFFTGSRDDEAYKPFFNFINDLGYDFVSIDYRLGLAGMPNDSALPDFIKALKRSIIIAVEDFVDATAFLLQNADELGLNCEKMIACGSSAGAITCMQTEYLICNNDLCTQKLPEGFNYSAIMSFAGGIVSFGSRPEWKSAPCPLLLFHGDADTFVPFEKVGAFGNNLYGSNYIVNQVKSLYTPYFFYHAEDSDHLSMAGGATKNNTREIKRFIDEYVEQGLRYQITEKVRDLSLPEKPDKYSLMDFVKSLTAHM